MTLFATMMSTNKKDESFPLIWDTGASVSLTFDKKDFNGSMQPIPDGTPFRAEGIDKAVVVGTPIVRADTVCNGASVVILTGCRRDQNDASSFVDHTGMTCRCADMTVRRIKRRSPY